MKCKSLIAIMTAILGLVVLIVPVLAQTEPPPPYGGLTNPFPWSDAKAQESGKSVYQQNCVGCHGVGGKSLPQFDLSSSDFAQKLESRPDYYFWIVSEGKISQGMPGYKSTLSEEQRWQVLNFIWSLSAAPSTPVITPPSTPTKAASITLAEPPQAYTGQELTLTATLVDTQNKPISGATVHFFIAEEFFARGLVEIGEVLTNEQGVATFKYTPRSAIETTVTARYDTTETGAKLTIANTGATFYRTKAGVSLPSLGPLIFIGPESSRELGEMGEAPAPALRLPGGILSPLWLYVFVLVLVWGTYLFSMYQALRISTTREIKATGVRLVPLVGLMVVFGLGLLMVLMIITGSFAHFHLLH